MLASRRQWNLILDVGVNLTDRSCVEAYFGPINNNTVPAPTSGVVVTKNTTYAIDTLNKPSGIVAGELLMMFVVTDGSDLPVFSPAVWTQLGVTNPSGSSMRFYCFARLATSTTAAKPGRFPAGQRTTSSCPTGDGPRDHQRLALIPTFSSGTTGFANPPSASGPSDLALWYTVAAYDNTASTNTVTAAPTGYTFAANPISSATASSVSLGTAYRTVASTTQDPSTFSGSQRPWAALTLAIPGAVEPADLQWGAYYVNASGVDQATFMGGYIEDIGPLDNSREIVCGSSGRVRTTECWLTVWYRAKPSCRPQESVVRSLAPTSATRLSGPTTGPPAFPCIRGSPSSGPRPDQTPKSSTFPAMPPRTRSWRCAVVPPRSRRTSLLRWATSCSCSTGRPNPQTSTSTSPAQLARMGHSPTMTTMSLWRAGSTARS